ncbi:MAG: hypothetical protein ACRCW2_15420 [Cellulosilyticaceae bacterium]
MKIKLSLDEQAKNVRIFDISNRQEIACIDSLKQMALYQFLTIHRWEIEEAVIPPVGSYRNALRTLYPRARVLIDPDALRAVFGDENDYVIFSAYEAEVAATHLCELEEEWFLSPSEFITQFYRAKCLEDARSLYDWWQINIPIQQPKLYRYIRLIEYFDQEIFNYFSR